jgi:hypothetical protein
MMQFNQQRVLGIAVMLLAATQALAQSAAPNQPPAPPAAASPGAPSEGLPQRPGPALKMMSPLPPPPASAEPPSASPRDFEGIWLADPLSLPMLRGVPPEKLTAKGLQKLQHAQAMERKGTPLASDAARCRPMNDIGIGWDLFPGEIIQTPREILVLQEEGRTRWVIHLDRGHPKSLRPSFWGDSVGHWEGGTLVVDTIGFSGEAEDTTLATHVISRVHKSDGGHRLQLEETIEDSEVYREPIPTHSDATWHPELQVLEFQCEENPRGAMEGLTAR